MRPFNARPVDPPHRPLRALPADGVTWRASFKAGDAAALAKATAILISPRFPGGSGWQSLPAWLPQEHAVWHAEAMWVLRAAGQ